jgi:NAD(P)-dependent dehydrogenase (short-subunit alcohol dehydrogenase family)
VFATFPSLRGKTVFVTGGASGIGAAVVAGFVRNGAHVAFVDIDAASGEALVARHAGAPVPPLFIACDLRDIAALQEAVSRAAADLGPIAVLVNNAANDQRHAVDDVTPQAWDAAMAVNLRHQFFAAQAVRPHMRALGGGAIINFSSIAWMFGGTNMIGYATAKAGVIGLTNSLAREFGPDNIRVNAVAPGAVMTERQLRLWHTPETTAELVARQAIRADVREDDIAAAVLFLAADDSRMITKQCLVVDAGLR